MSLFGEARTRNLTLRALGGLRDRLRPPDLTLTPTYLPLSLSTPAAV
jgi:hypothetical protein